jgi:hypothetical protein
VRRGAPLIGAAKPAPQPLAGGMEPDEFPSAFKLLRATIRDLEAMRV